MNRIGFRARYCRSGSLARCQKQKDKRLWTDYSSLDIKHHLRYDGTYRLSLFMELSQSVVNYVMPCMLPGHVSQGPFHSYGVRRPLSTTREMMYSTKTKSSYFRFAPPTIPESPGHDRFKQLPTPRPEGLDLSSVVVAQGVVTSLIEPCINGILENQKPLFPV